MKSIKLVHIACLAFNACLPINLQMERIRVIETLSMAWRAIVLTIVLHPHVLVRLRGFEPRANRLKVYCSTSWATGANGAGGRIRTDVSKTGGLQNRSNRPLWDSCRSLCFCNANYTLFCLISFPTKKSYSFNKNYCATKRTVYCFACMVESIAKFFSFFKTFYAFFRHLRTRKNTFNILFVIPKSRLTIGALHIFVISVMNYFHNFFLSFIL